MAKHGTDQEKTSETTVRFKITFIFQYLNQDTVWLDVYPNSSVEYSVWIWLKIILFYIRNYFEFRFFIVSSTVTKDSMDQNLTTAVNELSETRDYFINFTVNRVCIEDAVSCNALKILSDGSPPCCGREACEIRRSRELNCLELLLLLESLRTGRFRV